MNTKQAGERTHRNGIYDRAAHGFIAKGRGGESYSWCYVPTVGSTQWFGTYEEAKAVFDAAGREGK